MTSLIILLALGCEKESEVKERIDLVDKMDPKLKAISVSPEQGLTIWVPEISNDPNFVEPLQALVGTKLGMPPEMQKKLEVFPAGNLCAVVRDPLTKICASLQLIETDWKIIEMGMKLEATKIHVRACYYKDGTMNDVAKSDEAYRGLIGVVQKYCNG